ncbi:MAG: glycosyltransferase family 4 protein [Candidatus Altiarchaeota archaeon]
MRIAYISDVMYPYVKGGCEKRIWELAKRLSKQHEVHIYSMKFWDGNDDIVKDGVHLHGVCRPMTLYRGSGRRSFWQAIYFSVKLFPKLLWESFDIVDCNQFPYFPIVVVKFYSYLNRRPFIVTWHEVWGSYWYYYLGVLGFIGGIVEFVCGFLPQKIIAVSRKTRNDLIKARVNPKKISVVYNGIDVKFINSVKPRESKFDVVFAGRLISDKNIPLLLRAVKLVPEKIKCVIIGDGPEKSNLIALSKELGISDNVTFFGFQDYDDLMSIMKSSKVFVLPSSREGFGIVVLEANACNLPVIVLDYKNSAAVELVEDGITGLICKPSEKVLAENIRALLHNEKRRSLMGEKAANVAKNHDWDSIAEKVEEVYKSL